MLEMRSEGDDGVDWSPETSINYHQTYPNMEPTRKIKKRTPMEYVDMGLETDTKRTCYIWKEIEIKSRTEDL